MVWAEGGAVWTGAANVGCKSAWGLRLAPWTCSTITSAVPVLNISSAIPAALESSMIPEGIKGPRSLTRTVTVLILCLLVIWRTVPKGKAGWAAVNKSGLCISPEAVSIPSNPGPYKEAVPSCLKGNDPASWANENTEKNSIMLTYIFTDIMGIIIIYCHSSVN